MDCWDLLSVFNTVFHFGLGTAEKLRIKRWKNEYFKAATNSVPCSMRVKSATDMPEGTAKLVNRNCEFVFELSNSQNKRRKYEL